MSFFSGFMGNESECGSGSRDLFVPGSDSFPHEPPKTDTYSLIILANYLIACIQLCLLQGGMKDWRSACMHMSSAFVKSFYNSKIRHLFILDQFWGSSNYVHLPRYQSSRKLFISVVYFKSSKILDVYFIMKPYFRN